jgi:integrase
MQARGGAKPRSRKIPPGIRLRHSKLCAVAAGKRCSCTPSYEAVVSFGRGEQRRTKTFATLEQAKTFRVQIATHKQRLPLRARSLTLRQAAEDFLAGARSGSIVTRGGARYRPSVIRSYEQVLWRHVLPDLGGRRLADISTIDLQALVERLRGRGLSPSTIRNATTPIRAIYRRAVQLGMAPENPTRSVTLPSGSVRRAHAGDPASAARMIGALEERDQPVFALAFYAGLRLGELRALRWGDVDHVAGVIHVRRSWDPKAGEIPPKSFAGTRDVPILALLTPYLEAERARSSWSSDPTGLVLGSSAHTPFGYGALYRRSAKAWSAAGLTRVTPHQARHSFASFLIAAGADVKTLTALMGHGSARMSIDTYGHLFDGAIAETAGRVNAWLEAANTQSRVAQLERGGSHASTGAA